MEVTREIFIAISILKDNALTQLDIKEELVKRNIFVTKEEIKSLQKQYNPDIQKLRNIYHNKQWHYKNKEKIKNVAFQFTSFQEFYQWYTSWDEIGTCCYCGVHKDNLGDYKGKRKRGKQLEVERVVTNPESNNLYNTQNCRLACYICNNAKSDFLNTAEFQPIAKGIYAYWSSKGNAINFPIEVYETFS